MGSMPLHETSSAEAMQPAQIAADPSYVWSEDDRDACARIFQIARSAGIPISDDCERALERAGDPNNRVNLAGVILAELGQEEILSNPRNRGVAFFAARIFEQAPTLALKAAGIQLAGRIVLAEANIPGTGDMPALNVDDQFERWKIIGGPMDME